MADITLEGHSDMGAGHFMDTSATLRDGGHIDATTRTRTVTWLGGYHGGVMLMFYDAGNVAIGSSNEHDFGVDGTITGHSDRTDYWGEDIDPGVAGRTARFDIFHFWSPKYSAINTIVRKAVEIGKTGEPLLQELKDLGLIG